MGIAAFTATSTIATILTTVIMDRSPAAAKSHSIIFTETKHAMGEATSATQVMKRVVNMLSPATAVAVTAAAVAISHSPL